MAFKRSPRKRPECEACPYYERPFVPSEGPYDAEVVFIGDSPWISESREGRPFVGDAGKTLDIVLAGTGFERRDVFLTNAVHCQPEQLNQIHPKEAVTLCGQLYLQPELERIQPKLVVPMGNTALKAIGEKAAIGQIRGVTKALVIGGQPYTILPTYHPSFLNRQPAYIPYAEKDFNAMRYYLDHGEEPPVNDDLDYRAVTTPAQLEAFFAAFAQAEYVAWDTETTGLDYRTDDILAMQFSFAPKTGFCLPFYHLPYATYGGVKLATIFHRPVLQRLYDLLHDTSKVYFFHNGKFDLRMMNRFFLETLGLPLQIDHIRWHDTMAMYGLLDENTSKRLKEIARMHTDLRYRKEDIADVTSGRMKKMTLEQMTHYGSMDSDACRRLGLLFGRQLCEQGLWAIYAEHDASDMQIANKLFKMELFGALVDPEELARLKSFMQEKLTFYYQKMETLVGFPFNPNSDRQLIRVLFDHLKFPVPTRRTPSGQIPTDKFVIADLMAQFPDDVFLQHFRMHRDYASIEETFVRGLEDKLDRDGRVHPDFGFTRMVSGRIACLKPNLANIPREREFEEGVFISIRGMFTAAPGKQVIYADSSQIEFKVAAVLSRDQALLHALFVDREDFHTLVARALYPGYVDAEHQLLDTRTRLADLRCIDGNRQELLQRENSLLIQLKLGRTRAKNFNFGRNYGAQPPKLAETMGVTEAEVLAFTERLAVRFPDFEAYLSDVQRRAIEEGELRSPFGRKRRFPASLDAYVRLGQARQGSNFMSQASAAYAIRGALTRTLDAYERVGMESYLFNQVYDCLIGESPDEEVDEAATILVQEMLTPVPELDNRSFAVEFGYGPSWRDAEGAAQKIYTGADLKPVLAMLREKQ
jgi:DNA polymerase-1